MNDSAIKKIDTLFKGGESFDIEINDVIKINGNINKQQLMEILQALKPWRKGPFEICDIFIQSEWNSAIKYNLIKNHLDIKNKITADIGCNNGYYMFRMLDLKPKKLIGFDPSTKFYAQFYLLNKFIKSPIVFEKMGLEQLLAYNQRFDFIIFLGVLYHRTSPIDALKILRDCLKSGGEILLDCLIIDSPLEIALCPLRYAKMRNVYFVPSISALENWLTRAGFCDINIIAIKKTDLDEQHKSEWIDGQSLECFLNPNDSNQTIEGFSAPKRIYLKAKRK